MQAVNSSSRMGCHCWGTNPDSVAALSSCADVGIGWVRATRQTQLDTVAIGPGRYDWARGGERSIDLALARGMSVMAILDGRWGNEGDVNKLPWCSPIWEHLDAWCDFVAAAVTHYRGRIRHWEVLNEPPFFWWHPPPAGESFADRNPKMKRAPVRRYAELLQATSRTIRQIDPDATVLVGSGFSDGHFLQQLYELGCGDSFDAATVHYLPCHHPTAFAAAYRTLRGVMARYGDDAKPLWDTESGPHGAIIGMEVESADDYHAVYNVYRHCFAHEFGLERYFWFNPPYNAARKEGVRVLGNNGRLSPIYRTFQLLNQHLGNGGLLATVHADDEVHLYVFDGPSGPVSVVWSTAPATMQLVERVAAVDAFGKPHSPAKQFNLTGRPLFIQGDVRHLGFRASVTGRREASRGCRPTMLPKDDTPVVTSTPLGPHDAAWNDIAPVIRRDEVPVHPPRDHLCAAPSALSGEFYFAHDADHLYLRCRVWDEQADPDHPSVLVQMALRDSNPAITEWPYFLNGYGLFNLHASKLGVRLLRYDHLLSESYPSGIVPGVSADVAPCNDGLILTAAIPWSAVGPCRPERNNPFLVSLNLCRADELLALPDGDDPAEWSHNFVDPFIVSSNIVQRWVEFH